MTKDEIKRQQEDMEAERFPLHCSICNATIPDKMGWKYGNNAEPINEGRCCNECNDYVVIPARLAHMFGAKEASKIAKGLAESKPTKAMMEALNAANRKAAPKFQPLPKKGGNPDASQD